MTLAYLVIYIRFSRLLTRKDFGWQRERERERDRWGRRRARCRGATPCTIALAKERDGVAGKGDCPFSLPQSKAKRDPSDIEVAPAVPPGLPDAQLAEHKACDQLLEKKDSLSKKVSG